MSEVKQFNNKIGFASTFKSIRTLQDNTLSITIHTQELDPQSAGRLFSFMNCFIGVVFSKSDEITGEDLDQADELRKQRTEVLPPEKSPSKRLKDILFIKWKHLGLGGSFDEYYETRINAYISHEKDLLDKIKKG